MFFDASVPSGQLIRWSWGCLSRCWSRGWGCCISRQVWGRSRGCAVGSAAAASAGAGETLDPRLPNLGHVMSTVRHLAGMNDLYNEYYTYIYIL